MIVGDGMMARAFEPFRSATDIIVFASGVSNSLETNGAAFARERQLLTTTRRAHPSALLLYFGTCSVADPERAMTPYVQHKLAMERFVEEAEGPWLVLRLPLAIGAGQRGPTLARFLYERITRGERFEVWKNATRYPIDVDDVVHIARRFLAMPVLWRRRINVALRAFPVSAFVQAMEEIVGQRALYELVARGQHYQIDCPEVVALNDPALDYGDGYLARVLRKYYGNANAGGLRP